MYVRSRCTPNDSWEHSESVNLVDMNTIKCDILLSVSLNVLGKNAICLGQSKLCGDGIFCSTSGVLLRTASAATHVVSWIFPPMFIIFTD